MVPAVASQTSAPSPTSPMTTTPATSTPPKVGVGCAPQLDRRAGSEPCRAEQGEYRPERRAERGPADERHTPPDDPPGSCFCLMRHRVVCLERLWHPAKGRSTMTSGEAPT
jgi:hypothetical protein